jgi:thiol-disulfide isomerase/thioredoxin
MNRRLQAGLLVSAALTAGALGFWLNAERFAPAPTPAAMETLWRAELKDLQGQPFKMDALKGRPVVVNFWASWCGPCIEEMPDFQRASQTVKGKKVAFVGIGIDYAKNMLPFADKLGITYLLLESGAQGLDLVKAAGNRAGALPYTVILNAKGEVVATKLGKLEYNELTKLLADL